MFITNYLIIVLMCFGQIIVSKKKKQVQQFVNRRVADDALRAEIALSGVVKGGDNWGNVPRGEGSGGALTHFIQPFKNTF